MLEVHTVDSCLGHQSFGQQRGGDRLQGMQHPQLQILYKFADRRATTASQSAALSQSSSRASGSGEVDEHLLPKAASEIVQVHFGQGGGESAARDQDEEKEDAEEMNEAESEQPLTPTADAAVPKTTLSRCQTASSSRSSSSHRSPRECSSASAQSNAIKLFSTPPAQRRRKSAFETSQAMRELFADQKADEVMAHRPESVSVVAEKGEAISTNGGMNSTGQKLTIDSSPVEGDNLSKNSEFAKSELIEESEKMPAADPRKMIIDGEEQRKNGGEREELRDNAAGENVHKDEKIQGTSAAVEVRANEVKEEATATVTAMPREEANANGTPRNKPRTVAKVAPFAYFPPVEQPQNRATTTTTTAKRGVESEAEQGQLAKMGNGIDKEEEHKVENEQEKMTFDNVQQQKAGKLDEHAELMKLPPKEAPQFAQHFDQTIAAVAKLQQRTADGGVVSVQSVLLGDRAWKEEGTGENNGTRRAAEIGAGAFGGGLSKTTLSSSPRSSSTTAATNTRAGGGQLSGKRGQGEQRMMGRNGPAHERGGTGFAAGGGGGGGGGNPPADPSKSSSSAGQRIIANGTTENGAIVTAQGGGKLPTVLIRNAIVVNDDDMFRADVLVRDGKIVELSTQPINVELAEGEMCEQIDAEGKCLLPAGIDFLHSPFSGGNSSHGTVEVDQAQLTKAAICGGTGTILRKFAPSNEVDQTDERLYAAFESLRRQINSTAQCNVALSAAVSKWQGEKSRVEMARLVQRAGINSFVLELTSATEIFDAMEQASSLGAICRVLPDKGEMMALLEQQRQRQSISSSSRIASNFNQQKEMLESHRIQELCSLAEMANLPLSFCSIGSSAAICQKIRECGGRGPQLVSEVPVQELLSHSPPENCYESSDNLFNFLASQPNAICVSASHQMAKDSAAQLLALVKGRMSMLWELGVCAGRMDPMRLVALTSANAARMLNIYPTKGRIAVGSDADLVLWDLQTHSNPGLAAVRTELSPNAQPRLVILGGRIRLAQDRFEPLPQAAAGQKEPMLFPLLPNCPHLFGLIRLREGNFNFADFVRKPIGIMINKAGVSLSQLSEEIQSPSADARRDEQIAPGNTRQQGPSQNRSIHGEQSRAATKIIQPPGGKSNVFW